MGRVVGIDLGTTNSVIAVVIGVLFAVFDMPWAPIFRPCRSSNLRIGFLLRMSAGWKATRYSNQAASRTKAG